MHQVSLSRKIFVGCNYFFLIGLSITCILPIIHVLMISFSSASAVTTGMVSFWPVDFSTKSYEYIFRNNAFLQSFLISGERVLIGVGVTMLTTIITAYPLSKEGREFKFRTAYAWLVAFTIIFNGGLIPLFITVKTLGLLDTFWSLILPSALQAYNVILMINFFRGLPKELSESAYMDGAGHWETLCKIYLPLSLPSIATIGLFTIVFHWNSWFDGLIYMNSPQHYPLSTYLQTILVQIDFSSLNSEKLKTMALINDETTKAAQIFIATLPILLVYPFIQRFFVKGLVVGSVKE